MAYSQVMHFSFTLSTPEILTRNRIYACTITLLRLVLSGNGTVHMSYQHQLLARLIAHHPKVVCKTLKRSLCARESYERESDAKRQKAIIGEENLRTGRCRKQAVTIIINEVVDEDARKVLKECMQTRLTRINFVSCWLGACLAPACITKLSATSLHY